MPLFQNPSPLAVALGVGAWCSRTNQQDSCWHFFVSSLCVHGHWHDKFVLPFRFHCGAADLCVGVVFQPLSYSSWMWNVRFRSDLKPAFMRQKLWYSLIGCHFANMIEQPSFLRKVLSFITDDLKDGSSLVMWGNATASNASRIRSNGCSAGCLWALAQDYTKCEVNVSVPLSCLFQRHIYKYKRSLALILENPWPQQQLEEERGHKWERAFDILRGQRPALQVWVAKDLLALLGRGTAHSLHTRTSWGRFRCRFTAVELCHERLPAAEKLFLHHWFGRTKSWLSNTFRQKA